MDVDGPGCKLFVTRSPLPGGDRVALVDDGCGSFKFYVNRNELEFDPEGVLRELIAACDVNSRRYCRTVIAAAS